MASLCSRKCWLSPSASRRLSCLVLTALASCLGPFLAPVRGQVENPTGVTVVSSASYGSPVAPDSLISIFGTQLASRDELAQLDAEGQLPTEVAGTRVEINGKAVGLIFVSPGQINCVLPDGSATGRLDVLVRSGTGVKSRGVVDVEAVAPGLFTVNASGTGPGSILNAITFAQAPFLVETLEIPGDDQRTRLAVYGTGIRGAEQVTATVTDDRKQVIEVEIQYAGPAPGFFGLDQINIVLPADLDGSDDASLTVVCDSIPSKPVTFSLLPLSISDIRLDGLLLSAASVRLGEQTTGVARLNGRAPPGGISVVLGSDNGVVQLPPVVTISEGEVEKVFPVNTSTFGPTGPVTLSVSAQEVTRNAVLTVRPVGAPDLVAISVTPGRVAGGASATGTIELSDPAPPDGVSVSLHVDGALATLPASVIVPFSRTSVEFPVTTSAVGVGQSVTITGTLVDISKSVILKIVPVVEISVSAESIVGGAAASARVTLAEVAPFGAALIDLRSDSFVVNVPLLPRIPQGQTSANFAIASTPVPRVETVTLTASYDGASSAAVLKVRPTSSSTLETLSLGSTIVRGGTTVVGTVRLTGPARAGGVLVSLSTSNAFVAQTPVFATVSAGASTAQFTMTTSPVASTTVVTVTASSGGETRTAEFAVN